MRWTSRIAAAALCAALQAWVTPAVAGPRPAAVAETLPRAPVTILVSIDGFRPEYRGRGITPNLDALAAAGISAAMRPSFPSKTFPNHWTLVTGLRPDRNGIVANTMEDAARPGKTFTMAESKDPFWWNAAEPIWVTAEREGVRSATLFWPGSEVAWGGTLRDHGSVSGGARPRDWWPYGSAVSGEQRVAGVLDWLRRPAQSRPRLVTLYFDTVDTAGHNFGPDAPETDAAIGQVDALIGTLVAGLRALGQPANLVIVADHGMAATAPERTIPLDRIANPADYRLFESGPYATFYPITGHEAALEKALLGPHPHFECWRKGDLPARLHYGGNARVPPYLCLAESGWLLARSTPGDGESAITGAHGYDPAAPDMAALFIASGPAIRPIGVLPPFDNVAVAPLLRDLLGLTPGVGLDGDDAPFRAALAVPRAK